MEANIFEQVAENHCAQYMSDVWNIPTTFSSRHNGLESFKNN